MKKNRQKSNWFVDTVLFTGFLVSFAMDLTGLQAHQWIGVFGGLLAAYHLLLHWDWVKAVTKRLFGKTSGQARIYYLLDVVIALGFFLLLVTGLLMSTWLDLPLTNYSAWKDFHVTTAIATLAAVVLKIGLHWRWIVRIARQHIFTPTVVPTAQPVPARVTTQETMNRRDFLKLMGIVGAASLAAFAFTLDRKQGAQAASIETETSESTAMADPTTASTQAAKSISTATPTTTATSTSQDQFTTYSVPGNDYSTSCSARCDKHCSYPGNCRHYQDTNGNNLCDLGECL